MPDIIRGSGLWLPHENAHCYIWVTNNFLPDGLSLLKELGFRYITNLAWFKPRIGIGQYFRGQHELLLFGVRGSGMHSDVYTGRRDLSTVLEVEEDFLLAKEMGEESAFRAPHVPRHDGQRKHSAKPHMSYERIEARSRGPYIEFFARSGRVGWRAWGNEAPK
jgi:N6-adenosine-specific RNA methylase IME4